MLKHNSKRGVFGHYHIEIIVTVDVPLICCYVTNRIKDAYSGTGWRVILRLPLLSVVLSDTPSSTLAVRENSTTSLDFPHQSYILSSRRFFGACIWPPETDLGVVWNTKEDTHDQGLLHPQWLQVDITLPSSRHFKSELPFYRPC